MDTINVAILKDGKAISCLVFGASAPDSEIQSFAELVGGTSFQKLEFNEYVANETILVNEKPFSKWVWNDESRSWLAPSQMPADGDWEWNDTLGQWTEIITP